jgi:N-acetylneuraminate synthase/N,N'-diacetyllegionaminate synthase
MIKDITIDDHTIGENKPVFIIAEAGSNHDGKLEQAFKLIDVAKRSGADAVKFQTFLADKIVAKTRDRASYLDKLVSKDQSMHDIFKKLEMPREWLPELMAYCKQNDIMFLSTPFDEEAVEQLEKIDIAAYKIASFELVHIPLLKEVAKTGKPIILSTGMANLGDIEEALEAIYKEGNEKVILMHCGINYPANFEDVHLRAMLTMRQAFQLPVGYSDHTSGITVPIAATALGACSIEKHFTLDRTLPGPDHPFALEPDELAAMVKGIRECEKTLGQPIKTTAESEKEMYTLGRRSIFAKTDIPKGTIITGDMLAVLRPGLGLMPKYMPIVIGRTAQKDIHADEPITWDKI